MDEGESRKTWKPQQELSGNGAGRQDGSLARQVGLESPPRPKLKRGSPPRCALRLGTLLEAPQPCVGPSSLWPWPPALSPFAALVGLLFGQVASSRELGASQAGLQGPSTVL